MPGGFAQSQGPSLVTQESPIGKQGPFQAGGQAPPFHWVTDSQEGEFNGIPGHMLKQFEFDGWKPKLRSKSP